MTEKDKEINELRRKNDKLNKTNTVLLNMLMNVLTEYNAMLADITGHSANIKKITDLATKSPE